MRTGSHPVDFAIVVDVGNNEPAELLDRGERAAGVIRSRQRPMRDLAPTRGVVFYKFRKEVVFLPVSQRPSSAMCFKNVPSQGIEKAGAEILHEVRRWVIG